MLPRREDQADLSAGERNSELHFHHTPTGSAPPTFHKMPAAFLQSHVKDRRQGRYLLVRLRHRRVEEGYGGRGVNCGFCGRQLMLGSAVTT